LYVTPLWSGLKDLLADDQAEAAGMPAFIRPLQAMCAAGHSVDLAIGLPKSVSVEGTGVGFLSGCKVIPIPYDFTGAIRRIKSYISVKRAIEGAVQGGSYDFVYGHGSFGAFGVAAANRASIPCGQRLYGTFLAEEVEATPKWRTFLRHPLEYLTFRQSKKFLIVTNDGTRGDFVHSKLAKHTYDFHFLINGVDQSRSSLEDGADWTGLCLPNDAKILFYPGRIDPWKRQDHGIRMLAQMHELGYRNTHLVLAGHTSQPKWKKELLSIATEMGVAPFVHHVERLGKRQMTTGYKRSLAVLSFYDVSNLGNVVIEALSTGALVVAKDDGSLSTLITHGENGLLFNDPEAAARHLTGDFDLSKDGKLIRESAISRSNEQIWSWEKRADYELQLIEQAVAD